MRIFVSHAGQQLGPFTLEELRRALLLRQVDPQDLACWEGSAEWVPVAQLPGIGTGTPPLSAFPGSTSSAAEVASGLSISSMVLGVISWFGLFCIAGIPAIICGHLALSRQKRAGVKSSGLAVAGLITGYLNTAVFLVVIPLMAAIAIPSFTRARERAKLTLSMQHARQINGALQMYAADHEGEYPPSIEAVMSEYLVDAKALEDPLVQPPARGGYWYSRPTKNADVRQVILAGRGETLDHKRAVGRKDGSVQAEKFTLPPER